MQLCNNPPVGLWLADTPGVHLQHRMQHLLDPAAVRQLLPKGPLKATVPPTPQQLATQSQADSNSTTRFAYLFSSQILRREIVHLLMLIATTCICSAAHNTIPTESALKSEVCSMLWHQSLCVCCRRVAACGSYFWGGLARIDMLDAPLSTSLAFYGPHALRVHAVPLLPSRDGSTPAQCSSTGGGAAELAGEDLLGQETVLQRGGLRIAKEVIAPYNFSWTSVPLARQAAGIPSNTAWLLPHTLNLLPLALLGKAVRFIVMHGANG